MWEKYYVKPLTIDRIRASWIGPEVERYAAWLDEQGYRPGLCCGYRRCSRSVSSPGGAGGVGAGSSGVRRGIRAVPCGPDAYGNRNLTEFDLGTVYDDATFDWVPAGGKPAPRDVSGPSPATSATTSWRLHGGSRRSVELCIMCHTAADQRAQHAATPSNYQVMVHKIHMGSDCPA